MTSWRRACIQLRIRQLRRPDRYPTGRLRLRRSCITCDIIPAVVPAPVTSTS
jgi:hypothetical protein